MDTFSLSFPSEARCHAGVRVYVMWWTLSALLCLSTYYRVKSTPFNKNIFLEKSAKTILKNFAKAYWFNFSP